MEFEEKEIMKDDCLGITNKMCVDILKLKSIKILSFIMFMFMLVLLIIETSAFLKTANLQYLIHYGPVYVIRIFMLLTTSPVFINKRVIQMRKDFCLWKTNSAGTEIEAKITKESKYIDYCLCGYLILALFTGIQFAIPKEDDQDLMFSVAFFHKYFNKNWSNILPLLNRLIFMTAVPFIFMPFCQMIYILTHLRFQLKMLVHYLENMDGTSCQKEIKKRIVFCLKRHAKLYCVVKTTRKKYLIIIVFLAGALGFPSLLMWCYLTTTNFHKYLRFASTFLVAGVTFCHVIHATQLMQDNSSEVFKTLLNVKWYNWNKENKQIYLIFLTNAMKEIEVIFSPEVSLNYRMGVSLIKTIFSFSSVLYQFKKKD